MEPLTKSLSCYDSEFDFTGDISVTIATISATVDLAWIAEAFADFGNDYCEDEHEKERKRNRNHFANGKRSFTVTKKVYSQPGKILKTKT